MATPSLSELWYPSAGAFGDGAVGSDSDRPGHRGPGCPSLKHPRPPGPTIAVRTRVRRLTAAAAVVVLGLGVGAYDAVHAPRARVVPPPSGATPEDVTAAFFHALSVKDRATALALVAPEDTDERAAAQFWMDNTWSLLSVSVDPGTTDPGSDDLFAGRYRQLAEVRSDLTPHWLPWVQPPEVGLEPGPLIRFVTLGRNGPGQRWVSSRRAADPELVFRVRASRVPAGPRKVADVAAPDEQAGSGGGTAVLTG